MEVLVQTERYKFLIALLSVGSNVLLVALKLIVGFVMGSISVISEALHSGVDVFAAIVATVGVRRASEPADERHAFGHGKFESLSGLIQAILIFLAAGWILYEAVHKLIKPGIMDTVGLGVVIMFVSAAVNTVVGLLLLRGARTTDSVALKADALHCLTDVYTSAGVMLGLCIVWAGRKWFPSVNLTWVDPMAAMAVSVLIVKAAWNLTLESARDLLDASLPRQEEDEIKSIVFSKYPKVISLHKFRSRRSGAKRFVEFHIQVDPAMSVETSHELDHGLAEEIKRRFPSTEVIMHIEPHRKKRRG
ncbi:MAG TPA: cation diffusion facilitator family transporter [Chitinivibrionales bacterium]|nr:cation diffusion facilitator family transporter [Chitinivibrionales bacterium]